MANYPGKLLQIVDEFGYLMAGDGKAVNEEKIPKWKESLKQFIRDHPDYQRILKENQNKNQN